MRSTLLVASSLLAATSLSAQVTEAWTIVNQLGFGCQGSAPTLSGGVIASTYGTFNYDAGTGILRVTLENNTPIVPGEATALITEVHFCLPPGAVTAASLLSQTGLGGAAPAFSLSFDADVETAPNPNSAGCLGDFNITLDSGGIAGGVANASATQFATPNPVLGPVVFELQLAGPGVAGINAEGILASYSLGNTLSTNLGLKFEGAGVNAQESGILGSCDVCRTSIYTVGDTSIGQSFDVCVTGGYGCHACVWTSVTPGPTVVGPYTVPIGAPIVAAFTFGNFGLGGAGNSFCVTVNVPNDPLLSGFEFYVANVTYNALNLDGISFSPAFTVTIN